MFTVSIVINYTKTISYCVLYSVLCAIVPPVPYVNLIYTCNVYDKNYLIFVLSRVYSKDTISFCLSCVSLFVITYIVFDILYLLYVYVHISYC